MTRRVYEEYKSLWRVKKGRLIYGIFWRVHYSTVKGRLFYEMFPRVDYSAAKGRLSYGMLPRVHYFMASGRSFIAIQWWPITLYFIVQFTFSSVFERIIFVYMFIESCNYSTNRVFKAPRLFTRNKSGYKGP